METSAAIIYFLPYILLLLTMIGVMLVETVQGINYAIANQDYNHIKFFIAVTLAAAFTGYFLGGLL